eukprot:2595644-Rhodomonas_salina.2
MPSSLPRVRVSHFVRVSQPPASVPVRPIAPGVVPDPALSLSFSPFPLLSRPRYPPIARGPSQSSPLLHLALHVRVLAAHSPFLPVLLTGPP